MLMYEVHHQGNPYKGEPPRAWVRLCFIGIDGSPNELDLVADTGSPFPVVVSTALMRKLKHHDTNTVQTNFGLLEGAWVHVQAPELELDDLIEGHASDKVVESVSANHPDFAGLVGLPLLRMLDYGGNANEFWIRPQLSKPKS